MPYIRQLSNEEATGAAKRELDAAVKRAGRVWNIVRIMSLNGEAMSASMRFYAALMFGEGPLTRAQREMLATVVSRINVCHYWTQAHAHDLRAEVNWFATNDEADAYVHAVTRDWRTAPLSEVDAALCAFADKLTCTPSQMDESDIERLRAVGLDDRAIHDATQIIGYFNYIDRVADALGVEPETFIADWGHLVRDGVFSKK